MGRKGKYQFSCWRKDGENERRETYESRIVCIDGVLKRHGVRATGDVKKHVLAETLGGLRSWHAANVGRVEVADEDVGRRLGVAHAGHHAELVLEQAARDPELAFSGNFAARTVIGDGLGNARRGARSGSRVARGDGRTDTGRGGVLEEILDAQLARRSTQASSERGDLPRSYRMGW